MKDDKSQLRRKADKNIIIKPSSIVSALLILALFAGAGFWIAHLLGIIKGQQEINKLLIKERVDNSILNQKIQAVLDSEYPNKEKAAQILWVTLSSINEDIYPLIEYFTSQEEQAVGAGAHLKRMQNTLHKKLGIPKKKTDGNVNVEKLNKKKKNRK